MSILIGYATKSGAAKLCAELLAKEFPGCTICNLEKETLDISNYDTIIMGSGVRMGKIYKPFKNFMKSNMSILLSKKIAFYLCNAYPDSTQKAINKCIPEKLVSNALCIESFGGKAPFSAGTENMTWANKNNIAAFVQLIKSRI